MIFKSIRKIPQIYNISVKVEECSKVENRGKGKIRGGGEGDRRGIVEDAFAMLGLWVPPPHPSSTSAASHNSQIHSHADVHDTMETTGT